VICKPAARLHSAPQAGRFDSTPKAVAIYAPAMSLRTVPAPAQSALSNRACLRPQLAACWRWLVEKSSTTASACWRAELAPGWAFSPGTI